MKKVLLLFLLTSTLAFGQNLRNTMRAINKSFRQVNSDVRRGNNGPKALENIIKLKEATDESKKYLPRGISPSDSQAVERYGQLMTELSDKIAELEVIFTSSPLNKEEAQNCLKEINSIRKRGHSLFK